MRSILLQVNSCWRGQKDIFDTAVSVARELLMVVWELLWQRVWELGFHLAFTAATLLAMLLALPRLVCALAVLFWFLG